MNEIDIGHRLGAFICVCDRNEKKELPLFIPIFNQCVEKADVIRCAFMHILIRDVFSLHALMRCSTYTPFLMMWVALQPIAAVFFREFLLSMSHICLWVRNRHVLSWHKISHKYYLIDVNAQHSDCCHDRKEEMKKAQDDWLIRDEKNEPVDFTADLSALGTPSPVNVFSTTLYMPAVFKWSR